MQSQNNLLWFIAFHRIFLAFLFLYAIDINSIRILFFFVHVGVMCRLYVWNNFMHPTQLPAMPVNIRREKEIQLASKHKTIASQDYARNLDAIFWCAHRKHGKNASNYLVLRKMFISFALMISKHWQISNMQGCERKLSVPFDLLKKQFASWYLH